MKPALFFVAGANLLLVTLLAGFSNAQNDDEYFRKAAKDLLESSKSIKEDIVEYLTSAEELKKNEIDIRSIISATVNNNSRIIQMKESLKNDKAKCKLIFDEKMKSLIDDLVRYSNDKIYELVQQSTIYLDVVAKNLDTVKNALTKDLDLEISRCRTSVTCKITGRYKENINDDSQMVKFMRLMLPNVSSEVTVWVGKDFAPMMINEEVIKPVTLCIQNLM